MGATTTTEAEGYIKTLAEVDIGRQSISHFNWFDRDQLPAFVSESLQDESEDTKDADEEIQYQHWIDDEILNFNDRDNEV
ncbi:hypothetical protein TNCV_2913621 [Trichonephila clavipes]|nr:hypothetical protein TNCV_2913621 [Trichonephila clavipes]